MMRIAEYDIIQNSGISAIVLHKFVQSYYAAKHNLSGPSVCFDNAGITNSV
jgi:hypothetical protein